MLKNFSPFNFCQPLKISNCCNLLQIDQQATVGWYQDIWDLFVTKNLYITYINQRISIWNEMCFAWVSCVPVNLETKDWRGPPNEDRICPRSVLRRHNRFFKRNIVSIKCDGSRSKGDLPILPILFKLWRSIKKESKGCEIQEVSNNERIPIMMVVKKHKASLAVFNKVKQLISEYYTGSKI